MTTPDTWTEHRREDGELLGWIRPDGELWQAIDLLGWEVNEASEWIDAEAALEARGIGWLADRFDYEGTPVRFSEVSCDGIVLLEDDFGRATNVGAEVRRIALPWPAPTHLRALER